MADSSWTSPIVIGCQERPNLNPQGLGNIAASALLLASASSEEERKREEGFAGSESLATLHCHSFRTAAQVLI